MILLVLLYLFTIFCGDYSSIGEEYEDIMDQIYIILTGDDNLDLPSYFNSSNHKWMEEMLKVGDLKMKDLSLVGSHDSATYDLIHSAPLAPNCPSQVVDIYEWMVNNTEFGKFIQKESEDVLFNLVGLYGTSTHKSIYDQLCGGVRFIDFRICWLNNTPHSCHGFYGHSYTEYLGDIQEFMRQSVRELVYVEFSHFYDGELDDDLREKMKEFVEEIEYYLGDYAVRRENVTKSVDEEVEKLLDSYLGKDILKNDDDGAKLIIWFDDDEFVEKNDFLWPVFEAGSYSDSVYTDYIENDQKEKLFEWISKEGDVGKLNDGKHIFSISWTMTLPETQEGIIYVVENALEDERWLSLHGFSNVINDLLIPFFVSSGNVTLAQQEQINIVWIDFFYESEVVELVKSWNMYKIQG